MSVREILGWIAFWVITAVITVATIPDGWHKLALHLASASGGH